MKSPNLEPIDQQLLGILNRKTISGLDALRALAVTLVFLEHFRVTERLTGFNAPTGSLGVMIFFVLSGFLITSMLLKEHRKSGTISLRNFYRRRAFRIFPTFYVCWILTTIVELFAHQYYWRTSVVSFFYMMDYGRALYPQSMQPYLHVWISWSLAIEEKFYLLWPLLLLTLLKKRTTLIRNLCLIILGQWIYRAILYLGFHVRWNYVYSTFDMRADALLAGCLLAILVANEPTRSRLTWLLRWQWLSLPPVLFLGLVTAFPDNNRSLTLALWTMQPPVIAILLLQFVYWGQKSWTICSNAVIRFIAHISYALYLYHPLASEILYLFHTPHIGYCSFALTVAMSTASYYLVERPFMRMRDKGHLQHESSAAAVPAS